MDCRSKHWQVGQHLLVNCSCEMLDVGAKLNYKYMQYSLQSLITSDSEGSDIWVSLPASIRLCILE